MKTMAGALAVGAGLTVWAAMVTPVSAEDALAGRKIVQQVCSACHGQDGIAVLPEAANLAGQDAAYIKRQLEAFKDGSRKNEQMQVFAAQLTGEQMDDLAAYYSQVEIKVVKVPGKK